MIEAKSGRLYRHERQHITHLQAQRSSSFPFNTSSGSFGATVSLSASRASTLASRELSFWLIPSIFSFIFAISLAISDFTSRHIAAGSTGEAGGRTERELRGEVSSPLQGGANASELQRNTR